MEAFWRHMLDLQGVDDTDPLFAWDELAVHPGMRGKKP
jgi:hypothetical protein